MEKVLIYLNCMRERTIITWSITSIIHKKNQTRILNILTNERRHRSSNYQYRLPQRHSNSSKPLEIIGKMERHFYDHLRTS